MKRWMSFHWRILVLLGGGAPGAATLASGAQAQSTSVAVGAVLERWLASERPPVVLARPASLSDSLLAVARRFYGARAWQPSWTATAGARLDDLLGRLQQAASQGLDPADYAIPRLRDLAAQHDDPDSLALLDLVATAAWVRYASDVAFGRLSPTRVDPMWSAAPRSVDLVGRLATALDSDRVGAALDDLAPPQASVARMRVALARYRAIAAQGGWGDLAAGPALRQGSAGPRVAQLLRRLNATGELAAAGEDTVFDSAVTAAVQRAQARHGLVPDGIVGPATVATLNVPVVQRIRQIELNLERWRWLPRDLGLRYLMVNSAAFALEVVDSGRTVLSGRVIAGRADWPTPIVSTRLTEVTFSPRWTIPRTIAIQEVLPVLRRHPDYLLREGIHVMSDTTPDAVELDGSSIAWDSVADSAFAYRLWQEPGPRNPLGRIRFTIPNRFGVALHDTWEPHLFGALARSFSHGCVRIADAERLAMYVLRDVPGWTADWIRALVVLPDEWRVAVPDSFPVHLSYWTAWVELDGTVAFRPDVYGWDAKLAAALRPRRFVKGPAHLLPVGFRESVPDW